MHIPTNAPNPTTGEVRNSTRGRTRDLSLDVDLFGSYIRSDCDGM